MPRPQSAAETHSPPRLPTPPAEEPRWLIWCDGSACPNPGRMGFGAVLRGPDGSTHTLSQAGHTSGCNNEAEARALLATLELAHRLGARQLRIHSDSDVLVRLTQDATSREAVRLAPLFAEIRARLGAFAAVEITWLPQHRNREADELARAALGLPPRAPAKPSRRQR